jgi:fused signal recognition particle receptor
VFDFLKRKIKESISKLTKKVEEEEKIIEKVEKEIEKKEVPKIEEVKKIEPELKEQIKEIEKEPEKKEGLLKKLKKAVSEKKIEEKDIENILKEMEESLISSDVAVSVSDKILKDLKANLVGKSVKKGDIEKIVKESMKKSIIEVLDIKGFDLLEKIKSKKPSLIVFLGFNGSGKTTTIARLGSLFKKHGLKVTFAAADTWRAASIEQLEEHGKKIGIDVIKHKYGADPAAVIFDAVAHARANGIDVVLADTAGRSHANVNLMDELKKIIRVNKPDLKILVLDSLTGNDIYDQCKLFNEAVGVDGLILTKVDVYEKGGAAISASHTINKPILFLGVGQNYEDLQKFDADKIVENLFK